MKQYNSRMRKHEGEAGGEGGSARGSAWGGLWDSICSAPPAGEQYTSWKKCPLSSKLKKWPIVLSLDVSSDVPSYMLMFLRR